MVAAVVEFHLKYCSHHLLLDLGQFFAGYYSAAAVEEEAHRFLHLHSHYPGRFRNSSSYSHNASTGPTTSSTRNNHQKNIGRNTTMAYCSNTTMGGSTKDWRLKRRTSSCHCERNNHPDSCSPHN